MKGDLIKNDQLSSSSKILLSKVKKLIGLDTLSLIKKKENIDELSASNLELDRIELEALDRIIKQEKRRQINIISILNKSVQELPESSISTETIDDDWLINFFNIAQDCSNETLQFIWAKLLANEVDKPGSISRRTLNIVKLLSAKEAKLFQKIANCIWKFDFMNTDDMVTYNAICDVDEDELYSIDSWGLVGQDLWTLTSCNLITEDDIVLAKGVEIPINYLGKKHKIISKRDDQNISVFNLLNSGVELYKIITKTFNDDYYKISMDYLKGRELLVE